MQVRFLPTVPEEDEKAAGCHGDLIHEHLIDDATRQTGFCRDHRGKLQSMWELCEDEAQDAQDCGKECLHEDLIHEHLIDDATRQTGFCRDHRGKLQSMWELCEDEAQDAQDCGKECLKDEVDQHFRSAAETRGDPNFGVNRLGAQARQREQPADRLMSGALELRGSVRRRTSSDKQAICTIQHDGVITFRGALRPDAGIVVLAEVPVSDIIVTIVPDQTRKFSICYPEDIDSTQVWCCAKNQKDRDKWLTVLHRLGVDIYCECGDGEIERVRHGVQAPPDDNRAPRSVRSRQHEHVQ